MSEYNEIVQFLNSNMPTAIIQYPTGKYGIVGKIPVELTEEYNSGFTMGRKSKIFETEEEIINSLLDLGITKFQKSDCTWHKEE